jgi:hypothetical protein
MVLLLLGPGQGDPRAAGAARAGRPVESDRALASRVLGQLRLDIASGIRSRGSGPALENAGGKGYP